MELLDHDGLQRTIAADILVQEDEKEPDADLLYVHIDKHRYVVRKVCDHRDLCLSGLFTQFLEYLLQTDRLGGWILYGNIRVVLHLLFPVLQILPGHCIGRDQTYIKTKRR